MHWIFLSIISALLLGAYDAAKKLSVRDNAVPAVLFLTVAIGAAVYSPVIVWSAITPASQEAWWRVHPLTWQAHGLIMAKSLLVGMSWTFAFSALKHLPLSIAAPIRATSPFWVISIAILFFQERPSFVQWMGIAIVLLGFWRFSTVGRREGIRFTRDRSVYWMVAATLLGACSSIYDKWLLQHAAMDATTLQAWFTVYLVPVMIPLALRWYRVDRSRNRFRWRWSIAAISPLLIIADWFYFVALSDPAAMISVVSVVRRSSVLIALAFGAHALSEANFRAKIQSVAVILVGVLLLTWHR